MRDGWRETTLGQVATATTSQVPAATSGLPYYGLEHFDSGSPRISRSGDSAAMDGAGVTVSPGDVLFSKLRPYLNKVAVAGESAIVSTEVLVYRPISTELDASYLALLLRDARTVDYAVARSAGSRMPRTSAKVMAELPISLPPLDEQRRIVDLIAAVDDAVDAAEAEADTAKTARDEMLTAMLAARDGWRETTLGEVASFQNGYPFKPGDLSSSGVPVLRIKQLLDERVTPDRSQLAVDEKFHVKDGDLVFSWSATLAVRRWNRGHALLNQHLFRVESASAALDDGFLYPLLDWLIPSLPLHGTTMRHVTKRDLAATRIALPPLDEQRRIVATVKSVDDALDAARATAESLRTLRSNLLTVLLSGEHEIPSSYDALLGEVA